MPTYYPISKKHPSLHPTLHQVIIVDLDYTTWQAYVDEKGTSDEPPVFPEVAGIFNAVRARGIPLAFASKSPASELAETWLRRLQFWDLASSRQIYHREDKSEHFGAIKREVGVPLSDALFFDDERPNIKLATMLGITSVLVPRNEGLTVKALEAALARFASALENDRGF